MADDSQPEIHWCDHLLSDLSNQTFKTKTFTNLSQPIPEENPKIIL
jgi:hypothetical protein